MKKNLAMFGFVALSSDGADRYLINKPKSTCAEL